MKGKRIFDRFGFNFPLADLKENRKPKLVLNYKKWEYNPNITDWENTLMGERLSGYEIPSVLKAILENNINTSLN